MSDTDAFEQQAASAIGPEFGATFA